MINCFVNILSAIVIILLKESVMCSIRNSHVSISLCFPNVIQTTNREPKQLSVVKHAPVVWVAFLNNIAAISRIVIIIFRHHN